MQRSFSPKRLKVIFLMTLFVIGATANSQPLKGLYVDGFFNIIGEAQKEEKLLSYAKANNFNYLILYNTTKIHRQKYPLDSRMGSQVWARFIKKAKSEYAILKIGVVGEKADSFIPVIIYNHLIDQSPNKRIDVLNLEFEFWNNRLFNPKGYYCTSYLEKQGYACTKKGAFAFYMKQLREMQKSKGDSKVEIETYIGNPSDEQLAELAKLIDRLLIHYYRKNTDRIAFYKLNRLIVLQEAYPDLKIAPIFSSRENHSGPWLKIHKIDELTSLFFDQLKSAPEINLKSLNFSGIVWYRYSNMPNH